MKTHCRQWVCGHCDCLVISLIFRLTTFDVRIRRQKSSKSANRVFYISLNKGYFGKAIFSRLFSALCGNSVVSVHHINNFWNTRLNLTKFSGQSPQWLRIVCAKLHVKRLGIDWDINKKRSADVVTTLAQCFTLITFEVLNQTPPNLLGSCGSSTRWYLQNYIKNGWELTSELTSKWIYIYWNTQANFTLISLITFEVLAQTLQNSQGSGHNTIRWRLQNYMEDGWELTSELTSK